ncbi:hypothetical protein C5D43_02380 [Rathayibacter toxicus]|nr:transposase family protein [Rathayibacter toxicus]PPI46882.1 hypothetical protein C5D43_02380 [Rathayibacter toxicus]
MIDVVFDGCEPELRAAVNETTTIVEGTLLLCWSWKESPGLYSGKHHATGHNIQVVSDLNGRVVAISDPLPGSTHDKKVWKETGYNDLLDPTNMPADLGYQGTQLVTPMKKKPGKKNLDKKTKKHNTFINTPRYVIANITTWRILHIDYRRPLRTHLRAFTTMKELYSSHKTITLLRKPQWLDLRSRFEGRVWLMRLFTSFPSSMSCILIGVLFWRGTG